MNPLLVVDDVTKKFGGFLAVDGVSLSVDAGEIHAVIGPNGAGKSTLFKLLTGVYAPTRGTVEVSGTAVTGMRPHGVARAGLVQVFQTSSIFPRLTVEESVATSLLATSGMSMSLRRRDWVRLRDEVASLLGDVGLLDEARSVAAALSHGDQRALEVAVALGCRPSVLLLDEPTAGMSPFETERMVALIKTLREVRGVTIVLSEHDMDVVFGLSDRVTVMHHGQVLRVGSPGEVANDEQVIAVYLGGERV
ncbi:MAG: ABC transporter ATP-binding protein [Acidimicrobiales bacterium]